MPSCIINISVAWYAVPTEAWTIYLAVRYALALNVSTTWSVAVFGKSVRFGLIASASKIAVRAYDTISTISPFSSDVINMTLVPVFAVSLNLQ